MSAFRNTLGGAVLVLGLIGLAACGPGEAPESNDPVDVTGPAPGPGTVSEAEQAEGWRMLFDGQTLAGWRGYKKDGVPEKWVVQDGAIYFDPNRPGSGGDLITEEEFDNFELTLEWKIGACGNSGIFYNVSEDVQYDAVYYTGPEYQVLDNSCHPDAENAPDRWAGANYALQAPAYAETGFEQKKSGPLDPAVDVARPAGEWNETRIVVRGNHVEHWLNGQKLVEYEQGSEEWKRLVAQSKFDAWKTYGVQEQGHLALQDHGDPVWYRNIRIRPLDGEAG